jgi:lysophospholipase L1-like esterase
MNYDSALNISQLLSRFRVTNEAGDDRLLAKSVRSILLLFCGALVIALSGCTRRTTVPSGTIAFLGDSITAGYGLDDGQSYPALISIPGMKPVNLGVSGSRTDDGLTRLKAYFDGGGDAHLVVIALGANDILQNVDLATTEANLLAAIQVCRDHKVPVLLCGIQIPFKWAAGAMYDKVASEAHVPLLPDLMQGEEVQPSMLQDDGMNPNAAGQKLIAEKMQAALLAHFSFK